MTHVIKFQAPFEKLKISSNCPDIALRRAIIVQAIIDASNSSDNKELKKYEAEAKAWIFGKGNYFLKICQESNLEPDFIRKVTREAISLQKSKKAKISKIRSENKEFQQFTEVLCG